MVKPTIRSLSSSARHLDQADLAPRVAVRDLDREDGGGQGAIVLARLERLAVLVLVLGGLAVGNVQTDLLEQRLDAVARTAS